MLKRLYKYKKILIISLLCILTVAIRYFNHLIISSSGLFDFEIRTQAEELVTNRSVYKGFDSAERIRKWMKETRFETKSNVQVVRFFDFFFATKYMILNESGSLLTFDTPWFSTPLPEGVTRVHINSFRRARIVYPDSTAVAKHLRIKSYYWDLLSDLIIKFGKEDNTELSQGLRIQRDLGLERVNKLFSLHFYLSIIGLLFLRIRGYRIHLAAGFYMIMWALFSDMFIKGGIFFDIPILVTAPAPAANYIIVFFLLPVWIRVMYKGFQSARAVKFIDICFIVYFMILPFILYI